MAAPKPGAKDKRNVERNNTFVVLLQSVQS